MCKIVCQDIAGCIFQGIPPIISPLDLDIQLPCYETIWEAKTASECLQHLQNMPQQIPISTAFKQLRVSRVTDRPLFEASGFGMLILVAGECSLTGNREMSALITCRPPLSFIPSDKA